MLKRIGIIGDVHAEHHHLSKALAHLSTLNVDTILCTGDIVDGIGDVESCVEQLRAHSVQTVKGNHDRWLLEDKTRHVANAHHLHQLSDQAIEYLQALPKQIDLATASGQLMLCHGVAHNDLQKVWPGTKRMPAERSKHLDQIIADGTHQFMINGHVHYRTMIHFDAFTLLNAGTLRGDHHPGFSMLDLQDNIVRSFEVQPQVHEVKVLSLAASPGTKVFRDTQHFDDAWEPVTLYA